MDTVLAYFGKTKKLIQLNFEMNSSVLFFLKHRIPMPFTCTLRPRSKEIEALIRSSGNEECVRALIINHKTFN